MWQISSNENVNTEQNRVNKNIFHSQVLQSVYRLWELLFEAWLEKCSDCFSVFQISYTLWEYRSFFTWNVYQNFSESMHLSPSWNNLLNWIIHVHGTSMLSFLVKTVGNEHRDLFHRGFFGSAYIDNSSILSLTLGYMGLKFGIRVRKTFSRQSTLTKGVREKKFSNKEESLPFPCLEVWRSKWRKKVKKYWRTLRILCHYFLIFQLRPGLLLIPFCKKKRATWMP